jgi:hypothetical protein
MGTDKATSSTSTRTRYGKSNPEQVLNALWEQSVRGNWSGYDLRRSYPAKVANDDVGVYSHSAYRDATPGPYWSWQRFGRTSTQLPDGRVIHIAGEHEDSYDCDFCIYNDVVVEYPDGRLEFFLYPKDVFPPTDFHSATLIGHEILLIGSLGYQDMRRIGETQVLRLDTRTFRFAPVKTSGEGPGWLSRHITEMLGNGILLVTGGMLQTREDYLPNPDLFELDLTEMIWRRREHGDVALFPVPDAVYRARKNPSFGKANPERSDNPFWREMVRRNWPPSRARLHFGDAAPAKPVLAPSGDASTAPLLADIERHKLTRTIEDVVWTALREDAVELTLPDGRKLVIGGEVADYGEEYADPWVYNDVIVTHPGGKVEILTYPADVFPQLSFLQAVVAGSAAYIFGVFSSALHPGRPRGPAVLRLDTLSYEMTVLSVSTPPFRVNTLAGCECPDGKHVVFTVVRERKTDPVLDIAFDLETLTWGEPYPHAHGARN